MNNVEQILAIELMCAAQGIEFRKQALGAEAKLGRGTSAAFTLVRGHVPFIERDQVMYGFVEAVRKLVAQGDVVREVNLRVG